MRRMKWTKLLDDDSAIGLESCEINYVRTALVKLNTGSGADEGYRPSGFGMWTRC